MTAKFVFTPATKKALKARIALDGPSGSGKTWTSLLLAQGLAEPGERVALIDTERMSASLYADKFAFDTLAMHTFAPLDLVDALAAAASAGYAVLIIDSLSHFWMGTDGMLEQVDNAGRRGGGNNFGGWKEVRPVERQMIDAILAYPGHVIATMRTKTEWVLQPNEKGKLTPTKVGTKAEQRDGIEYEFTLVGDMDLEHSMVVSKSRIDVLADKVIRRPDSTVGRTIVDWLNAGTDGAAMSSTDWYGKVVAPGLAHADYVDLYRDMQKVGMLGAPVLHDGETIRLQDLVSNLGKAAKENADAITAAETAMDDGEPDPNLVTEAQLRKLHVEFTETGIVDRAQRLAFAYDITGHEVDSTKKLTKAEATQLIAELQHMRTKAVAS